MQDKFDRTLRTMFLRRKLRLIEARRIKYPQTYQGIFYTLIFVGAIGLIVTLLMCLNGNCSYLLAILFMLLFLTGVQGLRLKDESPSINEQEIDEMIERKKRMEGKP
jgi:hypothetical protein